MYLKSIELQGFKSFPEKTTLTFKDGITVIVGPNGSGKSNIADAMRWVLGEVSSRNIRGTKMEDVIFGGSETRKPSSFAQVSLTIDNTSGSDRMQIDYDEVTVTRRYFRGGDSEYAINGKKCRLKDITALFMNTGIGKGGYSVIGQGKIAEIVSQKSEERRSVFEEAAGISKYKYDKNDAQKKLDQVKENLTRLQDINAELESRLGPLERESEKARRYMDIFEEKRRLDVALWLYDMAALTESISSLSGTYEIYANELEATEAEADRLTEKTGELFESLQNVKRETEKRNAELSSAQNEKAEAANKAAFASSEAEHIREKTAELQEEAKNTAERLAEAEKRELERGQILLQKQAEQARLDAELDSKQAAFDGVCGLIEKCAADIADTKEHISELEDKDVELRIRLTVTDTTGQSDAERGADLKSELDEKAETVQRLKNEADAAKKLYDGYEQKRAAAEKAAGELKEKITELSGKLREIKEKRGEDEVSLQVCGKKAETLKRMEELFEGYSHATRFVMEEYKKGRINGKIYAPVSQLISTDGKYTTAIECTLGSALQHIVVEDEAAAKAAMYALKAAGAGRTTFLPVKTVKPSYLSQDINELKRMNGFIGAASDLVTCDGRYSDICKNLLGRTAVFDNIDNAVKCAQRYGYKIRIVTLDGQQINAGGSFTGGSGIRDGGILSRGREITALTEQKERLEKQMEAADREIASLEGEISGLGVRFDSQTAEEGILSALKNEADSSFKVAEARLSEAEASLDGVKAQINGISEAAELRERERAKDKEEQERVKGELSQLYGKAAELDLAMDGYNKAQSEARAAAEAAKIAAAKNERDLSAAKTLAEEAKSACVELKLKQSDVAAAIERQKNRLEENVKRSSDTEADLSACDEKITVLQNEIAKLSKKAEEIERKYTVCRNDEVEKNNKKQILTEKKIQAQSKLENAESEREKLKGVLEENYELTYSQAKEKAVEYNCPEVNENNRPELAKRQTELRNKMRVIGHVNVSAIEEYAEVKRRHDEMAESMEDLLKSEAEFTEITERLDEKIRNNFLSAFEKINENFGIVFRRLFGGGTAELVLQDPDNVLETGIDINVAPPGKIIKSLSLLSGGEQSFVAIAIYLALLEVNPTPFIMLDEIEAALDDVNVDRFADYIRQTQDKTQFILISHRRGTMEAGEKLYGITMPVKGISKVIPLDISQIEEKIGKLD